MKAARIAEEIRAKENAVSGTSKPEMTPPPAEEEPPQMEQPARRTVIQAPVLVQQAKDEPDDGTIRIKAEPSREGDACKFMVNRSLFAGHSWYFPDFESAEGSHLAERLFSLDEVGTLTVDNSTATITRKEKGPFDWQPFAKQVGALIRETLEKDGDLIASRIVTEMPPESEIQQEIQKVIDTEVNPGVAGHGGRITLQKIEGNTVTIEMGGGCQGCSAADLTLKQGIHGAFRKGVPFVGAIYDETDHSAGQNPYFS